MTREVQGTEPLNAAAEPVVIVFDLGELTHDEAPTPSSASPLRSLRDRRFRRGSWRIAVAATVLTAIAVTAGWHLGSDRQRTRQAALARAHPPALAWLTSVGTPDDRGSGKPRAVLDLHVMNLGATDLRVATVASRSRTGHASASLQPDRSVVAAPGQTAHRTVVVEGQCDAAYTGASLQVALTLGAGADATTAQVDTVDDGSVGVSYVDVLSGLCSGTGSASADGGVDGVYVQQTTHAQAAVLVVTNHAPSPRRVGFATSETDGFQLHATPRGTQVLPAGGSVSILLTFTITDCQDTGRLSNYAQGVSLLVEPVGLTAAAFAEHGPPARLGIGETVLAPLGAAVQKACH